MSSSHFTSHSQRDVDGSSRASTRTGYGVRGSVIPASRQGGRSGGEVGWAPRTRYRTGTACAERFSGASPPSRGVVPAADPADAERPPASGRSGAAERQSWNSDVVVHGELVRVRAQPDRVDLVG